MGRKVFLRAAVFLNLFLSGCLYTHYNVRTEPAGAEVYVDGELKGVTPYTVYLPDPVHSQMVIKKKGYADTTESLVSGLIPLSYNIQLIPGASSLDAADKSELAVSQARPAPPTMSGSSSQ